MNGRHARRPEPHPLTPDGSGLQRVDKLLASRGFCSRREADEFLRKGWVLVDGKPAALGAKARQDQDVRLDERARQAQERTVTIILNKPLGWVSGQPEPGYHPAIELVRAENQQRRPGEPALALRHLRGLAPAGRLDIDSQGLIVFTSDGRIARSLVGEKSQVEKEYIVRIRGRAGERELARLRFGLVLDGRPLKRARVERVNPDQLRFVLNEGRKRQIRRMCEMVGLEVTGLKRVRIGEVRLGGLQEGKWRFLGRGERFQPGVSGGKTKDG